MSQRIEDYALIGNMVSGALVGRDGSIDWLCLPHFDSDACFAALLGRSEHGRWRIAPEGEVQRTHRCYRPGTAVLETTFETEDGAATLIDFMPLTADEDQVEVVRVVRGDRGRVRMSTELVIRFGYGKHIPWVRRHDFGLRAIAGPDALEVHTPVPLHGEHFTTHGEFSVSAGESVPFTLVYFRSHRTARSLRGWRQRLAATEAFWCGWSGACQHEEGMQGPWREAMIRSLITLKLLQFKPTGGIIAAPTTSLPERIGGVRNWDYRFCWIRDATFTLYALLTSGYRDEARAWHDWLMRAEAGSPADLQIMYGIAGERRLMEFELPWLPGYESSRPVRVGNAAFEQLQIDVYGELMDVLHVGRRFELEFSEEAARMQNVLLEHLERVWREPDEGIWEMRGTRRQFTHSKVMAWVAVDRAVKDAEIYGLPGPLDRWRQLREVIHKDVCRHGFSEEMNSFVQHYGGRTLDAALLLIPEVGFLPPEDSRVQGTVAAIERELMVDGIVLRYRTEEALDGLPPGEGAFLACSFWLADAYKMMGRHDDAIRLFEHLLSLRNDVGLLAEQYDPLDRRQVGNFPQGFSHIALINTAHNLISLRGPAEQRAERQAPGLSP